MTRLREARQWLRGTMEWAVFTVALGLLSVWLILGISWFVDEPLISIPLHDGTLFTFSIVVTAASYWAFRETRRGQSRRALAAFAGFIVLLALSILFYTIRALATAGLLHVPIRRDAVAGIGCAIGATIYSFACNRAVHLSQG